MNTRRMKRMAAVTIAMLAVSPLATMAQETAPLAVRAQAQAAERQKAPLGKRGAYMGVMASEAWMNQAKLSNVLLEMRLFTESGEQVTFLQRLGSARTGGGDIRFTLCGAVRGEQLMLQLDQAALDALDRLRVTEITVTDADMYVLGEYLTADLIALRSAFGVGESEFLCVSGEDAPVTVVSVDGVRRQITN